ncbi:gamma-aminobutyric acid receptor subunit beta-2-like isoform X2 [Oculina patagonica]
MAWFIVTFYQALAITAASATSLQALKKHLINTNYDKGTHPNDGANYTLILVDLYVESFGKIEEVNMELDAYMYFRQEWRDPRLANVVNKTVSLIREDTNLIWRPDTFSYNSRETDLPHEDKAMHSVLRVHPNGDVFYSRNTHLVSACDMDLHNFPIDIQNCSLTFGSYGFSTSDVDYFWKREELTVEQPVMAQFIITTSKVSRKNGVYITGNYTIVEASFLLQRRLGYYMIQLYLPCIFLVMLSWIVFWMSPDNGGDRLTVGITCILTIVFLLGYVNAMLPKVSYVKGVDWYLMTSFLFIFLSLVECVLVERLASKEKMKESEEQGLENEGMSISSRLSLSKLEPNEPNFRRNSKSVTISGDSGKSPSKGRVQVLPLSATAPVDDTALNCGESESSDRRGCFLQPLRGKLQSIFKCGMKGTCPEKIDFACKILFPLTYIIYNTGYWYVYLNGIEILE